MATDRNKSRSELRLPRKTPSVSKLGRFTKEAASKADQLLEVLDQYSAPSIEQACADKIFVGKRPILTVVEPQSLCW